MLHVKKNYCSSYNAIWKITHLEKYIEVPWFFFKCDDLVKYLTHHRSALPKLITSIFFKLNFIENWLIWRIQKTIIQTTMSVTTYMYHQFYVSNKIFNDSYIGIISSNVRKIKWKQSNIHNTWIIFLYFNVTGIFQWLIVFRSRKKLI